jgi:glycosyltransferase involved in cell wall biosynthesis
VVSIITVAGDGAGMEATASSLRRQTLQQWEWVIVNDGSTGAAGLEALRPLREAGDPRIRVIDQPNRGLPAARNAGVTATRAPLLFFLDSDDALGPTALEKLAWLLHSDARPAFATAWCQIFGAASYLWPHGFESRDHFLFENMATPLVMMRREVFEAVGGFDEARTAGLEDYELWLRCAARGFWGRDIPEFLLQRHSTSREGHEQLFVAFRREMRERYTELYRDGLPGLPPSDDRRHPLVAQELPFENRLAPAGTRRLVYLLPQLDMGGVSTFALALLAQLAERGYRCTVVATMPVAQPLQAEFERFADVFVLHHFLRPADAPRFLRYLVQSRQADAVLNTNSLLGYRLLPFLRARCRSVALLDYNHMRDPEAANGGFPGFSAEYHALLDMQLASSSELRGWMIARGAPPERTVALHTPVDVERWRPDPARRAKARAELGIARGTPLILHAARITPQKQPQVLAWVLRNLARQGLAFQCVVAGDGPDLPWLRRFVRENGLGDRVRLLGAVDAERMRDLMAASDVLFLPSAYEGLALVLFEAMASGVVPVTVDAGGQRELVAPDCGILVAPDEQQVAHYTAALDWLLRAPRQLAAMRAASRRRVVEQFNMAQLGGQFEDVVVQASAFARARPQTAACADAGLVAASAAVEEVRRYQRNHRYAALALAWDWWQRDGSRYAAALRAGRDGLVRRTYPLRPIWRRIRRRWRARQS